MTSYRLKVDIAGKKVVQKVDSLPKEGETITLYGKPYSVEKVLLVKANFYRVRVVEVISKVGEVAGRMPVKVRRKSLWQKLFRR